MSALEGEPLGEDKFIAAMIRKFRAREVDPPSSPSRSPSSPRARALRGVLDTDDAKCRDCGAPIRWVKTVRNRNMPVDPEPVRKESGVRVFELIGHNDTTAYRMRGSEAWDYEGDLYRSHFDSCPEREEEEPEPTPEPEERKPYRAPEATFCSKHSSFFCPCVRPGSFTKAERDAYLRGEYLGKLGKGKKKKASEER